MPQIKSLLSPQRFYIQSLIDEFRAVILNILYLTWEDPEVLEDWIDVMEDHRLSLYEIIASIPDEFTNEISSRTISYIDDILEEQRQNNLMSRLSITHQSFLGLLLLRATIMPNTEVIDLTKLKSEYVIKFSVHCLLYYSNVTVLKVPSILDDLTLNGIVKERVENIMNLIHFEFKEACEDDLIEELSKHCPNLKKLVVKSSTKVTDSSVEFLLKMKNLSELNVSSTSITTGGYRSILEGSKGILNICWHLPDIETVLADINGDTLMNKEVFCGYLTSFVNLVEKCPNIKKVFLYNAMATNLAPSSNLNNLEVLDIKNLMFLLSSTDTALQNIGKNLKTLKLKNVENLDFRILVTHCICLQDLSLIRNNFVEEEFQVTAEMTHFDNLLRLDLQNNTSDKCYSDLVQDYKSLKCLNADGIIGFNDEYFINALTSGKLKDLELFVVQNCGDLGVTTAQLLIQNCPLLRVLGRLREWRSMNEDDIRSIANHIAEQNYDLEILY